MRFLKSKSCDITPHIIAALPVNNILPCLKIGVEEFKQSLPLLVSLRNPVLKARHLTAIEQLTGYK